MDMMDVGKTMNMDQPETALPDTKESKKKMYPSMSLEIMPEELKGKPIGSMCRLTVLARVKGNSETYDGKGQRIELEIQKVGYASAGQKTKDEYLKMNPADREAHDAAEVTDTEDNQDQGADDSTEGE